MKQVILRNGKAIIEEVPIPIPLKGQILVKNHYSVISAGTESSSQASLLTKVLSDKKIALKGLDFFKKYGLRRVIQYVKEVTEFGNEIGYSCAGEVVRVDEAVKKFTKGDMVACAGARYAYHAEYIIVPENLAVKIPQHVALRDAASTTLGAIALQGIRQADLKLDESCVVVGLGLLGQLAIQMLQSSGVTVFAIDIDQKRLNDVKKFGVAHTFLADDSDLVKKILIHTDGNGVDATLIYAASKSSRPLNSSMEYTRKRGKVIIVGAVGLNLNRSPWYEKEIELKISTSYGPGRYDSLYETKGIDYPYPYVRWTENRNMSAYLDLLKDKKVAFSSLVEKEFSLDDAPRAYELLKNKPKAFVLRYNLKDTKEVYTLPVFQRTKSTKINVGIIGLGSFATNVHIPNLSKLSNSYDIRAVCDHSGVKAKKVANQCKAGYATSDVDQIFSDQDIDAVFITTRHNTHAQLVLKALQAGKHVFLEKPLCLTWEELLEIKNEFHKNNKILTVGFNRRFSPYIKKLKEKLINRTHPLMMYYRMNAGFLPSTHWVQQEEGGGRIIGEVCHILDTCFYLINSPVKNCVTHFLKPTSYYSSNDNISVTLEFEDGSVATVFYTALGDLKAPKEYCEVFCDGNVYILDDYYNIKSFGDMLSFKTPIQDKGHLEELKMFAQGIKNGEMPISWDTLEQVTELSFQVNNSLKKT